MRLKNTAKIIYILSFIMALLGGILKVLWIPNANLFLFSAVVASLICTLLVTIEIIKNEKGNKKKFWVTYVLLIPGMQIVYLLKQNK
jgi:uncharacterized membrane protein YjjP (DUF1212 family)